MEIKMIDPMTWYVLIGGMVVIFVGLGLRQMETLQRTVPLWLWSGLAGVVLGASVAAFAVHRIESWRRANEPVRATSLQAATVATLGSPAGGGRGGMPSGSGSGEGTGRGGGAGQRARRELATLIEKLELVTRGVLLQLNAEQKRNLLAAIEAIQKESDMTEPAAQEYTVRIRSILTPEDSEVLALVDPSRAGRGSSGASVSAVGPQSPTAAGGPPGQSAGAPGGEATAGETRNAKADGGRSSEVSVTEDDHSGRLRALRDRLVQ